jgi:transposase-like protein
MSLYSLDLRRKIVDAYDRGEGSVRDLAERFDVAPNTCRTTSPVGARRAA